MPSLRCALLVPLLVGAVVAQPALARTPEPRHLLLTTVTSANYVSIADPTTMRELHQLGAHATAPSVPEVLPGGRKAYVQNAGINKGSISVLDTASLRITRQIEPSGGIGDRSARIQRDGRFYYYSSIVDGDVTQVDTRTDTVSRVFTGLGNVFTVSPDGRTLFVSGETDIKAIDARTGAVVGSVSTPSGGVPLATGGVGWIMVTPDGSQLVKMSNPVLTIDIRDRSKPRVTSTIPVGSNPALGDISPDSSHLWVPNSGDGTISVIDLRTHKVSRTLRTGRYMTALTFDPSGRHVFVAQDRPGGIGPNQADLVLLYAGQVALGQLTASQDGQYVSRPVLDTPGRVVRYDAATFQLSKLPPLLTVTVPVQLVAFDVR